MASSTLLLLLCAAAAYAQCPDGWGQLGSKCFWYSHIHQTTYDNLAAKCEEQQPGATAASIHSAEENEFIGDLAGHNGWPWLGLTKNNETKEWEWADQSPVNFTNYFQGEPDRLDVGTDICDRTTGTAEWCGQLSNKYERKPFMCQLQL